MAVPLNRIQIIWNNSRFKKKLAHPITSDNLKRSVISIQRRAALSAAKP